MHTRALCHDRRVKRYMITKILSFIFLASIPRRPQFSPAVCPGVAHVSWVQASHTLRTRVDWMFGLVIRQLWV